MAPALVTLAANPPVPISRRPQGVAYVAVIPKVLRSHIDSALPDFVCLVGSVLPDGYAHITPRGSTMVFDDEHIGLWERGRGATSAHIHDGTKMMVFFRKPPLSAELQLRAGVARFYGIATVHKSGPVYEEVWRRLVEPEKKADPDKKGFAVLIKVERAEDLSGEPLKLD